MAVVDNLNSELAEVVQKNLQEDDLPEAEAIDEDEEIRKIAEEELKNLDSKNLEGEPQLRKKKWFASRFMMVLIGLLAVVVVVVIVVAVVVSQNNNSSSGLTAVDGNFVKANNTNSNLEIAPPPGKYKCFVNSTELQDAVDLWLISSTTKDNFSDSEVYGPNIKFWCVSNVQSFDYLFSSIRNATLTNFDADLSGWDMTSATTMAYMFAGARKFRGVGLNLWNTQRVTNLQSMFQSADLFDADLSNWNVSRVVSMNSLFESASSFRGLGLNTWNVGQVQNMSATFSNVGLNLNFDASGWDVSKVVFMKSIFANAQAFTGTGLETWNVARVVDFSSAFSGASIMNADLSNWNITNAITTERMFFQCKAFNKNLCKWRMLLPRTCNISNMFNGTACTQSRDPDLALLFPGPFCQDCGN